MTYEKLKITSRFEIYKVMYHNGSYLLLFENREFLSFKVSCEQVLRLCNNPVDTRPRFNVCKTSIRRLIDIEMTSCVYWEAPLSF